MITYRQMEAYVKEILTDKGLTEVSLHPGPELPDVPDQFVVLTPYGGAGLELDGAFDARAWQVRTVGKQYDYDNAETIANVIDVAFLSHFSSRVGERWVPSIARVGGAPNPLLTDDADRTHFVCSYTVSVELALPN